MTFKHCFTLGILTLGALVLSIALTTAQEPPAQASTSGQATGWVTLFDNKSLDGWKSNDETPDVFSIVDDSLQVKGGRAHLFYVGKVNGGKFKNFEFKAKVKTTLSGNSGIYFHTQFQKEGWPAKGYECQVNTSSRDDRKTGSLYAVQDVMKNAPSSDDQWFDYYIKVEGKRVIIRIDDKLCVDYTEPADVKRPDAFAGRLLGEGTFCIQGHDPKSTTYYKDIKVRVLPD